MKGTSKCTVCHHESRAAIDQAIVNGKPLKGIALTFGFTYTRQADGVEIGDHKIIGRHRDRCMPEAYQAAIQSTRTEAGQAIATRIQYLETQVNVAITDALKGRLVMAGDTPMLDANGEPMRERSTGDLRVLLHAVAQGRANTELLAKLAGAVPDADQDAMDRARAAIGNPDARRLLAQLDQALADAEAPEARSGD